MAPVVIDLTSSPEPEDTPQRNAVLASFEPRKHKQAANHVASTSTAPVKVPLGSYGNNVPTFQKDDVRSALQTARASDRYIEPDANARPLGSFAPVYPQESFYQMPGTAGPPSQMFGHQSHLVTNGMSYASQAISRGFVDPRSRTRPEPPPVQGGRPSINGALTNHRTTLQAGSSNGHRRESVTENCRQAQTGAHMNDPKPRPSLSAPHEERRPSAKYIRPDRQDSSRHTSTAHASLVEMAGLNSPTAISPNAKARLYNQRDSETVAGSPLDGLAHRLQVDSKTQSDHPRLAQSVQRPDLTLGKPYACPVAHGFDCQNTFSTLKSAARHALLHTGEKNEICPTCSKAFLRKDHLDKHRQRCIERDNRQPASQAAGKAQRQPPALNGSALDFWQPEGSQGVRVEEPQFNLLKRSLPSPPIEHPNGTAKRLRIDLASPGPQSQPKPRPNIQLADVTDHEEESHVYSDESKNLSPKPKRSDSPSVRPATDFLAAPQSSDDFSSGENRNGLPYLAEEDALVKRLKEIQGLSWDDIVLRFCGRTKGSLMVRYSTLKKRESGPARQGGRSAPLELTFNVPAKRVRKSNIADGMVPWAKIKQDRKHEAETEEHLREQRRRKCQRMERRKEFEMQVDADAAAADTSSDESGDVTPRLPPKDSAYPSSMSRILRHRELGGHGRRAWSSGPHPVPDELKDHVFSSYGLQRTYQGMSGDVESLAWNHEGRFAASAIAITDQQSMQYNMRRNLLIGDTNRGELEELPHHHVPRPVIESTANINANHAMRESQDPRLFLTVNAARFCPQDGTRLFTASRDKTLRYFNVEQGKVTHRYAVQHQGPVDLLSIGGGHGLVATGCHHLTTPINIFQCDVAGHAVKLQLPARHSASTIYPSALKWGVAHQHRNILLAGFSGDEENASTATGETCLWDVTTGQRIILGASTRTVFDVAWNPIPSSSSVAFAVAGGSNGLVVDKGMRSVIQCFAAGQKGGRSVLDWQCPALDINDIVFCPHDDNLIAAGATNGRVYIWDKRSADRSQRPLHTLKHGESLNVLDHERDRESADTGVRFISWGPTKNRLYTGSSDGIVKTWNPYRSPNNAHIGDISGPPRERSAVMSGSFSPDFQELLIGTENGRINLFKSGSSATLRTQQFKLISAPEPEKDQQEPFVEARTLLQTGQIELRPCGAMPFRQAVQGPNYSGPFLKPRKSQRKEAEERLQRARLAQTRLDDNNDEADFAKAAAEVQNAEAMVTDLQDRKAFALLAKPKAKAFQRELAESEKARRELEALVGEVERCKLDCAVLPPSAEDEDEEVEDSGRSELRIPGFLCRVDSAAADDEVGTASDCPACYPSRTNFGNRTHSFSTACVLKRARLSAACSQCGAPTCSEMEKGGEALCERCAFGCFRCGKSVVVSDGLISCGPCGLEWEMGVLGYELVQSSSSALDARMKDVEDDDDDMMQELGDGEIDFYAGRWGA